MPLYNGDEVRFLITAESIIPVETELKASNAMIDILRKYMSHFIFCYVVDI